MGQHINLIVYEKRTQQGVEVSPVRPWALLVKTTDRTGKAPGEYRISFPMDTLFYARLCPNGEPAHISWKFCPWTGKQLPELPAAQ